MPRILGIQGTYKIPFRGTASSLIEAACQFETILTNGYQRLPNSRVHKHGCNFKQNGAWIPGIPGNHKINFRCTASSSIEAVCQIWNDSHKRLHSSHVRKHGCDFKPNIYKVVPRIPWMPGNHKISFRGTASSPIAVCQIWNDSHQRLPNSRVHKHGCDLKQNSA